jgi:hypothetical protein
LATSKQPALADATRGFDLDVFRLQNLGRPSAARALVESERDAQILFEALDESQVVSSAFTNPPFWESRFRTSFDAGVFYAASEIETAMAEVGYHRHKFLLDSPGIRTTTISMVSVATHLKAELVDVELLGDDAIYAKDNYAPAQNLALRVREMKIAGLHYLSVRSVPRTSAFAVFSAEALSAGKAPAKFWLVTITKDRVEFRGPDSVTEFEPKGWS